ncbi:MAG: DUF1330 domain-containing protein [Segniliparus sp.]|uniref:DUF1330 domain-containing protein n=1 Tax=Segniliparus sp. TaxID=2804064 RepID=UPI003F375C9A
MPAYVISVTSKILDAEAAQRYSELARPAALAHGGTYLARATEFDVEEARGPVPARIVVIEFADRAAAKAWYDSPEYAPAKRIAIEALDRQLLFVDSV